MNEKIRYLLKNSGLLVISNFSSRILVFLMVPLYTSVLSTEEYGNYDLVHTTILMLTPILSVNITECVFRFSINAKLLEKKRIFSICLKYVLIAIFLFISGTLVVMNVTEIALLREYYIEFVLMFTVSIIHQLIAQFAKGIDDIKGIAIAGILGTLTMVIFNIYFLLWVQLGLQGYFYANILASAIPTIYLFLHGKMYQYIQVSKENLYVSEQEREMLKYGAPLVVNNLSWYINNASDRYVVTLICGVAVNGIYSVAYKIPAILNAVQSIFIQAWQISAIKEFDPQDKDGFYSNTYQTCHTVMVMLCSTIIIGTRVLAKILFANDFYQAWKYVPTLLLP